jgi:hypothetical protein
VPEGIRRTTEILLIENSNVLEHTEIGSTPPAKTGRDLLTNTVSLCHVATLPQLDFFSGQLRILASAVPTKSANAQISLDIIVESVNNYGGGSMCSTPPNLCNSIANGDGFMQGMVFPGSRWRAGARYTDNPAGSRQESG